MDKIEKIKEWLKPYLEENKIRDEHEEGFFHCAMLLNEFIDTLSEEPNKSLEEAADVFANKEYPDESAVGNWGTGDYEPPIDMEYPREIAKDTFIAGASGRKARCSRMRMLKAKLSKMAGLNWKGIRYPA